MRRWWTAIGAGFWFGLGILTKEFTILVLPLFFLAFFLHSEALSKRLLMFTASLLLAAAVVFPWAFHVKEITGTPLGGMAMRAKGKAIQLIGDTKKWGIRDVQEIKKTVLFRGMISGPFRILFPLSLAYFVFRIYRKGPREGWLFILLVVVWFGFFCTFSGLSPNRRRLIPLLPYFSLFIALMFHDFHRIVRGSKLFGVRNGSLHIFAVMGVLSLLFLNLGPRVGLLRGLVSKAFRSPSPPLLFHESQQALACLEAEGGRVVSNIPNLFYFYGKGRYPVYKPRRIPAGAGPWGDGSSREESKGMNTHVSRTAFLRGRDLLKVIRGYRIHYVVALKSGKESRLKETMKQLIDEGLVHASIRCKGQGYMVYEILPKTWSSP
jgi:hypothetical protein